MFFHVWVKDFLLSRDRRLNLWIPVLDNYLQTHRLTCYIPWFKQSVLLKTQSSSEKKYRKHKQNQYLYDCKVHLCCTFHQDEEIQGSLDMGRIFLEVITVHFCSNWTEIAFQFIKLKYPVLSTVIPWQKLFQLKPQHSLSDQSAILWPPCLTSMDSSSELFLLSCYSALYLWDEEYQSLLWKSRISMQPWVSPTQLLISFLLDGIIWNFLKN